MTFNFDMNAPAAGYISLYTKKMQKKALKAIKVAEMKELEAVAHPQAGKQAENGLGTSKPGRVASFDVISAKAKPGHKKRKIRHLLPSLKVLSDKLWNLTSLYVRKVDKQANGGFCLFCGQRPIEDAAHIISRKKLATKFDLRNLIGMCKFCNWSDRFRPGYHDRIIAWYINAYGLERYQSLVEKSQQPVKFSRDELQTMIEDIKNKLEQ